MLRVSLASEPRFLSLIAVVVSVLVFALVGSRAATARAAVAEEPPAPAEEDIIQVGYQAAFFVSAPFPPPDPGVLDDDDYMSTDYEWTERAVEGPDLSISEIDEEWMDQ